MPVVGLVKVFEKHAILGQVDGTQSCRTLLQELTC